MTFEERVRALERFGFTPRQRRFIATVALHGGYCLRRQYSAFAGIQCGKNVRHFLETLVERNLADRFILRVGRGRIYHLHARGLYRAIGEEHNRNRRQVSGPLMARRLMVLDCVLSHPDWAWFATERDKVDLFVDRYAVPRVDLPQRRFSSEPNAAGMTRYFMHKLPVAVGGDLSDASFVYLATDGSGHEFEQFLAHHARLLASLPSWTVIATGSSAGALATCEGVFERTRQLVVQPASGGLEDLRELCITRQRVDCGDLAHVSVADIDRYRTLRDQFAGTTFEALYSEWRRQGEVALASYVSGNRRPVQSRGRLVIERLPFDYRQFGSLPGVA
jgi:hypothetical protein